MFGGRAEAGASVCVCVAAYVMCRNTDLVTSALRVSGLVCCRSPHTPVEESGQGGGGLILFTNHYFRLLKYILKHKTAILCTLLSSHNFVILKAFLTELRLYLFFFRSPVFV